MLVAGHKRHFVRPAILAIGARTSLTSESLQVTTTQPIAAERSSPEQAVAAFLALLFADAAHMMRATPSADRNLRGREGEGGGR